MEEGCDSEVWALFLDFHLHYLMTWVRNDVTHWPDTLRVGSIAPVGGGCLRRWQHSTGQWRGNFLFKQPRKVGARERLPRPPGGCGLTPCLSRRVPPWGGEYVWVLPEFLHCPTPSAPCPWGRVTFTVGICLSFENPSHHSSQWFFPSLSLRGLFCGLSCLLLSSRWSNREVEAASWAMHIHGPRTEKQVGQVKRNPFQGGTGSLTGIRDNVTKRLSALSAVLTTYVMAHVSPQRKQPGRGSKGQEPAGPTCLRHKHLDVRRAGRVPRPVGSAGQGGAQARKAG